MLKAQTPHRMAPRMTEQEPEDTIDAAAAALERVRQVAAEAGFRPGMAGQYQQRSKKRRVRSEQPVRSVGPQPLGDVFSKLDRKSTRLNSSHVSISYAVFCLKKKKHN